MSVYESRTACGAVPITQISFVRHKDGSGFEERPLAVCESDTPFTPQKLGTLRMQQVTSATGFRGLQVHYDSKTRRVVCVRLWPNSDDEAIVIWANPQRQQLSDDAVNKPKSQIEPVGHFATSMQYSIRASGKGKPGTLVDLSFAFQTDAAQTALRQAVDETSWLSDSALSLMIAAIALGIIGGVIWELNRSSRRSANEE